MRWLGLVWGLVMSAVQPGTAGAETYKGYEMPPYRVEMADGAHEVRDYGPYLVAEVTVQGDRSTAVSRGFRLLAGYIFGANAEGAKVAMTVPVAQTPDTAPDTSPATAPGAEDWVVTFMMPSAYTLSTLPRPRDDRVKLVGRPGERMAVVRFSGIPGERSLATQEQDLRRWIAAKGLTISAGPHYWFYDAPMTLPWNRRNEVAFTVK
jgi:hypothetical protein